MNLAIVLVLLAVIPTVLISTLIYRKDIVEKESSSLLARLFAGGILSAFLVIVVSSIAILFIPFLGQEISELGYFEMFISIFIGIALIEEACKWVIFDFIGWNNKEFNYVYDAIVYMTFIGLGFATIENISYVAETGIQTAILRAVCSVPGHVFFAIHMGYYLGLAKQAKLNKRPDLEKKNKWLSLIIPTIYHTIFDFCLFAGNEALAIVYFAFVLYLYISSIKKVNQLSKIKLRLKDGVAV
jgi:RsiW-degrading membrane proteinase PrsW (M82 family)